MNGREWLVEAFGCDVERLTSVSSLQSMFDVLVHELELHPVGQPTWHQFPSPGGITGMWLLAESHLTVHTFPEFESACINLFCCTPRRDGDWTALMSNALHSSSITVRVVERTYGPVALHTP